MPEPTLASRLPDIEGLVSMVGDLEGLIGQLVDAVPLDSSLLGGVGDLVGQVDTLLGDDPGAVAGGLTSLFEQGAELATDLVPGGAQDLVTGLTDLVGTITGHPISQLVAGDGGLSLLDALTTAFDDSGIRAGALTQITDLVGNAIPADALAVVTGFIAAVEQLEGAGPTDPAALVAFVADQVLAVPADALAGPWSVVDGFLGGLRGVAAAVLPDLVVVPAGRIEAALTEAAGHIAGLDPTDLAAVEAARTALTQAQTHLAALRAGLASSLTAAEGALAGLDVPGLIGDLRNALESVPAIDTIDISDVRDTLFGFINDLTARAAAVDAGAVTTRLTAAATSLDQALEGLGMNQAREDVLQLFRDLAGTLGGISEALAGVVETLRGAISGLGDAITDLGADQVAAAIESVLQQAADALSAIDVDALVAAAGDALRVVIDAAEAVPIEDLTAALEEAFAALAGLLTELGELVRPALDQAGEFLDTAGDLDFDDVADPVLAEIDSMTGAVRALDPARLSAAERAALAAAAAILQFIDFPELITSPLTAAFDEISTPIREAATAAGGRVTGLLDQAGLLDPSELLQPLLQPYRDVVAGIDGLDPSVILGPVREALAAVAAKLQEALDPQLLLAPLQAAFDELMAAVDSVAPAQLAAPIADAVAEVEGLVDRLDLTPILERVVELEEEVFGELRQLVVTAIEGLGLPEPFTEFLTGLTPLLDLMSPAAMRDPQALFDSLRAAVDGGFRPGDVFAPLDRLYQRVVAALDALPEADLLAAFGELGGRVGQAFALLDPQALADRIAADAGAALPDLDQIDPAALTGVFGAAHGGLLASFTAIDQTAVDPPLRPVLTQIGILLGQLDPALALSGELGRFGSVRTALAALATPPDLGALADAATPVQDALAGLVPDFLAEELSVAGIRAGLQELSPARIGDELNAAWDDLMAAVAGLEAAVQPALAGLFGVAQRHFQIIDPVAWGDVFEPLRAELRSVIDAVNPQVLVDELQDVFDQVRGTLAALDPTTLTADLTGAFQAAIQQIADVDLDPLEQRIEELLTVVKSKLTFLDPERLELLLEPSFAEVEALLGAIDFSQVMEALDAVFDGVRRELEEILDKVGRRFATFQNELARVAGSPLDALGDLAGDLVGGGLPF